MDIMVVEGVISVGLGLIFVASAIPKLRHPKGFAVAVLAYDVLPPRLARLYAWLVPSLELLVALLLMAGTAARSAAVIASLLLLSFMIAIGLNIARGRDLDCHCFGATIRRRTSWGLVLQDGALLGAAVFVAGGAHAWVGLEPWSLVRLSSLTGAGSGAPLLGCIGLVASAIVLSRAWMARGRRYRQRHTTISR